jgi:hypothetical protein
LPGVILPDPRETGKRMKSRVKTSTKGGTEKEGEGGKVEDRRKERRRKQRKELKGGSNLNPDYQTLDTPLLETERFYRQKREGGIIQNVPTFTFVSSAISGQLYLTENDVDNAVDLIMCSRVCIAQAALSTIKGRLTLFLRRRPKFIDDHIQSVTT